MLPAQQSVQHIDSVRLVIALMALGCMVYWRQMLRLLLVLMVIAAVVGAVVLLQIMHA